MTLFVVPTPIGNLEDITLRALRILKEVDQILCEDTRVSGILLRAHAISTPTTSYHKFNERAQQESLVAKLLMGQKLALISSAGTPGISDPGLRLISAAILAKIPVCPLPGPCAPISALIASGFSTEPFQFWGFLERRGQRHLAQILEYGGTSICLESPRRLEKTLRAIETIEKKSGYFPRKVALVKEISKIYEKILWGTAIELIDQLLATPHLLKGEWIVVIGPSEREKGKVPVGDSLRALWKKRRLLGLSRADFAKEIAAEYGVKRQQIYQALDLEGL